MTLSAYLVDRLGRRHPAVLLVVLLVASWIFTRTRPPRGPFWR